MSPATHSEREKFVADLVRHAPASDSKICGRLMRFSGAYHRLAAQSRTLVEQRKFERIKSKVTHLCEGMGCGVAFYEHEFLIAMPDGYTASVPQI